MKIVLSLFAISLVTTCLCAPGCQFAGTYKDEYGGSRQIKCDGMIFGDGFRKYYSDLDYIIHEDGDTTTGTFQSDCNVINWSNGGSWIRTNMPPPAPTPAPPPAPTPAPPNDNCLCVFDVDRTLTGGQHNDDCQNTTVRPGVVDTAYGGGILRLSDLATNMDKTFCKKCFHAIVTRGDIGGSAGGHNSKERDIIFNEVVGPETFTLSAEWEQWHAAPGSTSQDPDWKATSALIYFTNDGHKQEAVKSVVKWFGEAHNKVILPHHVHFFDDRADNVQAFQGTGFNAHQVSCAARDEEVSNIGKCGGTRWEIVEQFNPPGGAITICGEARAFNKMTEVTV